jgi:glutathione synthase/RimK-type ligase-like ATP-grasp enzyme
VSGPVAVVTCAGEDVDPDSPTLLAALDAIGVEADLVVWDDPAVNWDRYALSVIRSTWDYVDKYDAFTSWVERTPRLVNDRDAVRFSLDKHYLAVLASRGIDVVDTQFVEVGTSPELQSGEFVVKPAIGAGSMGAERFGPGERDAAVAHVQALHASGRAVLIQPYVESVDTEGELALIYIGGAFSHAMTKGAMLGVTETDRNKLFRMEQMSVATAPPAARATADAVIEAAGFGDLLYARVDLVRTGESFALMELELVEPSLFFYLVPDAAVTLAAAIAARFN